jgi:dipeptidyl aminopeptidase/acylaminoacyl peptidase
MKTGKAVKSALIPSLALAAGLAASVPALAVWGDTPLIPRATLFGNPDRAAARLSPDGKHISWLADLNGVLNVFVAPVNDLAAARPVTNDAKRGIRSYFWAYNNEQILYIQDKGGDENWRVYAVDVRNPGEARDLTPFDGVAAQIEEVSEKFPDEIVVGLNNRDPQLHDLHRVNIRTGQMTKLMENEGFVGFTLDDTYAVRGAARFNMQTGGMDTFRFVDGRFVPDESIPQEDASTTSFAGWDKANTVMYMVDSRGRNTAALIARDTGTDERRLIAENDLADVSGIVQHPVTKAIQAVGHNFKKQDWIFLDPAFEAKFNKLRTLPSGRGAEVRIGSRTLDDSKWIVAFTRPDGPVRNYLFDTATGQATFLFVNNSKLLDLPLADMHAEVIKSRDGLNLVSYLTLPVGSDKDGNGRPESPVPMVLLVHGGPWARDGFGYNSYHQMLANRGYAVLSVNFRGSTGFGKNFLNAGDKEWAGKMHDDLIDAVNWAVTEKISPKDKVAIMGGSYGGYAALVGMTFTPDVFAAGVSIVGPSNIVTLLNTIPPYWQPMVQMFKNRVGDHTSEEGRKFLESRSPLALVDRIHARCSSVRGPTTRASSRARATRSCRP